MAALSNISAIVILAVLAVACTSAKVPSHDRGPGRCVRHDNRIEKSNEILEKDPDFVKVDSKMR